MGKNEGKEGSCKHCNMIEKELKKITGLNKSRKEMKLVKNLHEELEESTIKIDMDKFKKKKGPLEKVLDFLLKWIGRIL